MAVKSGLRRTIFIHAGVQLALAIFAKIATAFVSTNSICQGESVGVLWNALFRKGIEIQFAHRSFVWASEAHDQAAVHCVIVGFTSQHTESDKTLYENGIVKTVEHINGYLIAAPDVFIQSRGKVLAAGLPEMSKGSQPTDGGFLLFQQRSGTILFPNSQKQILLLNASLDRGI